MNTPLMKMATASKGTVGFAAGENSDPSDNREGLAVDAEGTQRWYKRGHPHREDGPAVVYTNGEIEWWVEGKMLNLEEREDMQGRLGWESPGSLGLDTPGKVTF